MGEFTALQVLLLGVLVCLFVGTNSSETSSPAPDSNPLGRLGGVPVPVLNDSAGDLDSTGDLNRQGGPDPNWSTPGLTGRSNTTTVINAIQSTPSPTRKPTGVVGGTDLPGPDLDPAGDPDPGSRSCSVCAPGYGVLTLCNGTHDTLCGECPPGTYSDSYTANQPCRPCNSCPDGFYERTPCVNFQDVNCAMCYKNGGGFGNEDFLRKCETTTTSSTTISTAAPSTRVTQRRSTVIAALIPPTPPPQQVTSKIWHPVKSTHKVTTSTESPQPKTKKPEAYPKPPPSITTGKLKPLPPVKGDNDVTTETDFQAAGVGEEPKVGAATGVETGGWNWTIFIAVVAAAVVFFVLGVLISSCVHRPNIKAKAEYALDYGEAPQEDDTVDASPSVTMISNRPLEGAAVAYEDYDNPSAPMYTGKH